MFGCLPFFLSFKSSISLTKTSGNSRQAAELRVLNADVKIRQRLQSFAHPSVFLVCGMEMVSSYMTSCEV